MRLRNLKNRLIYEVAEALGLRYTGDASLEHGGTFYNPSEWHHEYAEAVEVMIADGCLFVTVGVINADKDVEARVAREFGDEVDPKDLNAQIESCLGYSGVEDQGYGDSKTFELSEDGYHFKTESGWVSMDDLEGYVLRKFVLSISPAPDLSACA